MSLARKVALNTSALVAGRAVVVVGGLVAVTAASRYLGLESYGAYITAVAFVGILEALTDLGVYTIAAREIARAPQDERRILGSVLTLSTLTTSGLAVAAWGLLQLLYAGEADEQVREGATLLMIGLVAMPLIGVSRAHFVAAQRAYRSALGDVASVVTTALIIVLAVVLDWGFAGIVAAYPAGRAVQAVAVTGLISPGLRLTVSWDWSYSARLLVTALPLGAAMVASLVYFRIDALLVGAFESAEEVALYGLAFKVVETMLVLPGLLMATLYPEIARLERRGEGLRSIMTQAVGLMVVIAVPTVVLIGVFAEELVTLVGGAKFEAAASTLRLMGVALALTFLTGVYGQALVAIGRQADLLRVALIVLVVNVGLNVALIPVLGIEGAAAALVVSDLINLLAVRHAYLKHASPPERGPRARLALAGCSLLVAVAIKQLVPLEGAALLVVGVATALSCYLASLLMLNALPRGMRALLLPTRLGGGA